MPGTQTVTADGVIGVSGVAVRVFSAHVVSGAQAANVKLYNGTSATGDYTELIGTANEGKEVVFGEHGTYFPAGCYADLTNATSVSVDYEQVSTI